MNIDLDKWLNHEWAQHCQAEDDEQKMINLWGDKCDVYQKGCSACEAWREFESSGEIIKS